MSTAVDQPRAVREEDALDLQRVDNFLRQHIAGLEGTPTLAQFPGGASNLTYLISYGERELVLRRPPPGAKAKSAHDMLREAQVMAALKPHYSYVPAILATCDDNSVIGHDFYVMERLRGSILRRDLPTELGLDVEGVRKLCQGFVDRLIELHRVDATSPELQHLGKGDGYIARQVAGWSDRWQKAATDDTDACTDVVAWLMAKQPLQDNASCVIHNDYRFDNVVLDPEHPLNIIGVLDWEMATIGDPLMDLGGSLAYWVQADDDATFQSFRRQPTHVAGMLTRREVIDYYGEHSGLHVENFDFYEAFGLFRLMVIIQQIYRRYVLGQTSNPQFAGFGQAARYMAGRCRRIIAGSSL
ncbi:phosphotransferase family protein [Rhodanobacter sp. AS-Z3]|uniref:phosphotransferase family protein n=1 Tax=Rhodanobacter sp. AS-Z3 TaxID=3031330 RepID=UPI00247A3F45|nr:phosphotransferase family protein [Rhodanobacter sp. AS-Z3]WEN13428.1 phosphotransferase family protein [Rhodanobacter sp. AS-Z3]